MDYKKTNVSEGTTEARSRDGKRETRLPAGLRGILVCRRLRPRDVVLGVARRIMRECGEVEGVVGGLEVGRDEGVVALLRVHLYTIDSRQIRDWAESREELTSDPGRDEVVVSEGLRWHVRQPHRRLRLVRVAGKAGRRRLGRARRIAVVPRRSRSRSAVSCVLAIAELERAEV